MSNWGSLRYLMKRRFCLCAVACLAISALAAPPDEARIDFKQARLFWAFQPVKRPTVPQIQDAKFTLHNPVDAFVHSKLEEKGLQPAPPITRTEFIRRLSFDLIGLPPSPEEIRAFVEDQSPGAYEGLVDRLLGSPHFGERWAQHWLDTVRFAETEGFEYDRHLPDAWRYRDYVIQAFNSDKPFDQFVTEQIAGDELASSHPDGPIAAIFHRLGPVRRNAGNPEIALSRNEVLTERTDVIGTAFLGLTVGCARCHNHKLDPILQKDYYRLQAYLAATHENDILLVPPEEKALWEEKTKTINAELRSLRQRADEAEGEERTRLKQQVADKENDLPPLPAAIPSIRNDQEQRTVVHVLKRGEWEKKGEAVGPRPLSVLVADDLPELAPDLAHPRIQLARWLTDPNHPLIARVIVNRLWQHHFGRGLVKTANDFGTHGDRPSHPELLDWLATELIASGWKLKPLHRLMVLSSAYRQSSRSTMAEAATRVDPENRLLWHFNQRRLSAEEIRDAMLAVSGTLNPKLGGVSVMVPVDKELVRLLYKPSQWEVAKNTDQHHRRSIYLLAKRNLRLPFLEAFDQPALLTSCGRRESSTHAPQALELLNGKLSNELAAVFASRLTQEAGGDVHRLIERAYWLALGRPPTPRERALAAEFLKEQPMKEFTLALLNLNAFIYVE